MSRSRPGSRRRRSRLLLVGGALVALLSALLAPQAWLAWRYRERVFETVAAVPRSDLGVVFGALVRRDGSLSDAVRERLEAAIALYRAGRVERLFISGDDRHFHQAQVLARTAEAAGVPRARLLIDAMGYDTHDTCRHLAAARRPAVLVTQGYHLRRAMLMCESEGVTVVGLAAEELGLLDSRGGSAWSVATTRAGRLLRESALTWGFIVGLYQRLSDEAERAERPTPTPTAPR